MNEDQTKLPADVDQMPPDVLEVAIVAAQLGVAPRQILRAADAGRVESWSIEIPGHTRFSPPTYKRLVSLSEVRDWFNATPEARKPENKSHQYHVVYWVQTEPKCGTQDLAGFIRANAEAVVVKREFIVQLRESDAAVIEQIGGKQIERTYGVKGFSFRRLGT
jgi:hypothetical protein